MKLQKGFTLIELLVVIAIIGILSSVVLASLNTARNKGADAAVKSNLANARAEAELFLDNSATKIYEGVCGTTGDNVISDNVTAAGNAAGVTTTIGDATAGSATVATCHDSDGAWAAFSPLKTPTGTNIGYCVDSTGASKEVATFAASTYACS